MLGQLQMRDSFGDNGTYQGRLCLKATVQVKCEHKAGSQGTQADRSRLQANKN